MVLPVLMSVLLAVAAAATALSARWLASEVTELSGAVTRTETLADAAVALHSTLERARARRIEVRDSVPHPPDR